MPAASSADVVHLKLIALNDLHGNLLPPAGGIKLPDPAQGGKVVTIAAGGVARIATAVRTLTAEAPNHAVVAAGDLVGASPLLSALFHDEPTVESLNAIGLEMSAVGNHEFDEGLDELLRLQRGGCHPTDDCKGAAPYAGARFDYLAASTIDTATGRTVLPPYRIKRYDGVAVAFIGLTLKGTPNIVSPAGVRGLRFEDEAKTVNALVPELQRQGVQAIVVLLHEGGRTGAGINECPQIAGPVVRIVEAFDPAVDVVISGHTHQAYVCRVAGRLVTSAHRYGTLLTDIDLTLSRRTGDVIAAEARNVVVDPAVFAADAAQERLVAGYRANVQPLAERVVGRLVAPLTRHTSPAGESMLGRVVADAHLAATSAPEDGGAEIAFTNPGGLRTELSPRTDGSVRYEDVFAAQPFGNQLVTMTLTGAQVLQLLESQRFTGDRPLVLPVSSTLHYAWDGRAPAGRRVVPGSVTVQGRPLDGARRYRVTVNSFMAGGGDLDSPLTAGTDRVTGKLDDVDALAAYLTRAGTLQPPADARIRRIDAPVE